MINTSITTIESLISIAANGNNFNAVVSNLQGLYAYLQHSFSSRCEDGYLRLLADFLENYLDAPKKLFSRKYLGGIIAHQTHEKYAHRYFNQRCAHAEILGLLKHHRT